MHLIFLNILKRYEFYTTLVVTFAKSDKSKRNETRPGETFDRATFAKQRKRSEKSWTVSISRQRNLTRVSYFI